MDIKDRIRDIMVSEGLTAGKLAAELGVRASAISHILSDRNKPSYEFFIKILERYPSINANWLLTGKGDKYTNNASPELAKSLFETVKNPINTVIKDDKPAEYHTSFKEPSPINLPTDINPKPKVTDVINLNSPRLLRIIEIYDDFTSKVYEVKH